MIQIKNIDFRYPGSKHLVFRDFSLELKENTFMACSVRMVQARAPCSTSSADCSASNKVPFSWMAFRHKIAKPRC